MTRALAAAALAVAALTLTGPAPAQAAGYSGGSCQVKLTYGAAVASYTTTGTLFGSATHVSLATTGDQYRLVADRVYTAGGPPARGITGDVDAPRGWTARGGYSPRVMLSVAVVDTVTGVHGTCHT